MYGDLSSLNVMVGSLDLTRTPGVTMAYLNVYEDMKSPSGPLADVYVIDAINALGTYKIVGSEAVSILFTANDFKSSVFFEMSNMHGVDYKAGSMEGVDGEGSGSMYHKEYILKMCSPEFIAAQGNYVKKEYEQPCHAIVQDVVSTCFKSSVSTPDPTDGIRRMIAQYEHPFKFLNRVMDDSISTSNKSSLYVLYKARSGFIYETYENAFTRKSGVALKVSNRLKTTGTSYQDKITSLMWYKGELFYRPTRPQNKPFAVTYNMGTGTTANPVFGGGGATDVGMPFNKLGVPVYELAPPDTDGVPIFVTISPENNPYDFKLAKAKEFRLAFQSHLTQNEITFECVGNPNIQLGSTFTITIPDMYKGDEASDKQLSGEFLATAIQHKIRGINCTPRYTMIIKGIKAAFAVEGGSTG